MACISPAPAPAEEETELRRGQWTAEEDVMLVNYIKNHGEGRWDYLAASSGTNFTLLCSSYVF